jgi:hypothetical protein
MLCLQLQERVFSGVRFALALRNETVMSHIRNNCFMAGVSAVLALTLAPIPALSITVELAKKCRAMAIKAYPTTPAGTLKGSAAGQREFYQRCIDRNGDIEVPAPTAAPVSVPMPTPAPR